MTASYLRAKELCENFHGIGLGLRWEFLDDLLSQQPKEIDFLEFSPENYMGRGGYFPASLEKLGRFYPLLSHGLTMSVGSAHLPDEGYFESLREELKKSRSPVHSDHLSLGQVGPLQLHELLPLPRTPQYVRHVADHIAAIEERLQCPFLIENISSYIDIEAEGMREVDFITAILERSDSGLLLDVNNLWVNATNHHYDPVQALHQLPVEKIVALHIAGHQRLEEPHPAAGMLLDNHGAKVCSSVKELFEETLKLTGPLPVLLERDHNVPPLTALLDEVRELRKIWRRLFPDQGESQ